MLYGFHVIIIGRADKLIVAYVHKLPYSLQLAGYAVDVFLRRNALLGGGVFDLETVFVGTRQEKYVIAAKAFETRERVGHNDLVRVADMRLA